MQHYKVGGAVRDKILGRQPYDIDYVVIGQTPEKMIAAGFQPVGQEFPVFIHPQNKSHFALARTERKAGVGHKGFVFYADQHVSLEQDLLRRDFTINAMAESENGEIIDPYGGRRDISLRTLRHVSSAFSEDPLRLLRAARYRASLDFQIAPETHELMCEMVAGGELDDLSAERIWQELARGLMCNRPKVMIEVLRNCGALAKIMPEVEALFGVPQNPRSHPEGCAGVHSLEVLQTAADNWWPLQVRWAALLHDLGKAATSAADLPDHPGHEAAGVPLARQLCKRLKVPAAVARCALAAVAEHGNIHRFAELSTSEVFELFARLSAWRDTMVLDCVLAVADCDHAAHPQISKYVLHPNRKLVQQVYQASASADVATAAQSNEAAPAEAVRKLRTASIAAAMDSYCQQLDETQVPG